MMVTFISMCEKNALPKSRRVLDAFAERIGDRAWQTAITVEGLNAVKKLLRKIASKNTAVACHLIRGHKQSELAWIVGNRQKFNEKGIVPVNSTKANIINTQWENDWHYLPLIKSLSALAGLFHDWGKASLFFQQKLKTNSLKGDPIRHEWISFLLLKAFVNADNDEQWLRRLAAGEIDEKKLRIELSDNKAKPLKDLPDTAKLIAWLIVSHHRLPNVDVKDNDCRDEKAETIQDILGYITRQWGYENNYNLDFQQGLEQSSNFSLGFPVRSRLWLKQAKKWALKMQASLDELKQAMEDGSWRSILHYARLSLMLGDHNYSSQDADKNWHSEYNLIANTYRCDDKQNKKGAPKQKLDEHLVGVAQSALRTAALLPLFETEPPRVYDIKALKKPSSGMFKWQDRAADKIKIWQQSLGDKDKRYGFFAVNMASTGCGKTYANAKIMRALSSDNESLRYILALGLRTLTLQTGDEYRERIGLDSSELAVLIGSQAVMDLHQQNSKEQERQEPITYAAEGSESLEELLDDGVIDYECAIPEGDLTTILTKDKDRKFLYAPVLACTIDHLMAATETKRGGRYILPSLRLMSSDLVLDEVDDFSGKDLIAIGRLIHLAGMLGRKVMISSATIPPDLAEGYFNIYREGWRLFAKTRKVSASVGCAWIDEFGARVVTITESDTQRAITNYRQNHCVFTKKRAVKLKKELVKRKAEIINCEYIKTQEKQDELTIEQLYFQRIQEEIVNKHRQHFTIDSDTQKQVSFGLVRVANINPCIAVTKYLIAADWPNDVDVKIMAYHSQQVLLMRSEQEKHLDVVLKRKDPQAVFANSIIREHIDNSEAANVVFILVATPVEEVGRDHDFDWAVVEPSSFRSIIQLAGRILRHRTKEISVPNIALLQYNLRALKQSNDALVFRWPGYETDGKYKLATHDMFHLVDEKRLRDRVDALPRILRNKELKEKEKLADLEHFVTAELLTKYTKHGPETMQGWLTQCWWLTALPQTLNPFRESAPQVKLYLVLDDGEYVFIEKDEKGYVCNREAIYGIEHQEIVQSSIDRLWLQRDYQMLIENCARQQNISPRQAELKYGEISFRCKEQQRYSYSSQFGLSKLIEM
jgi:CRISPR-associated endonuclease/helicase Cas3